MKFQYIASLFAAGVLLMTSCSDFTDIDAKGNNLLDNVNDLELLLNANYTFDDYGQAMDDDALKEVSGDILYSYSLLSNSIIVPKKTAASMRRTWDEQGWVEELPDLTNSDDTYTGCYKFIGRVANAILSKIDAASGDQAKKDAVKAEAYIVRAYFHWVVAQKFVPAYNPSTAANTVALPYMTDKTDFMTPQAPIMLDKYYENIFADIKAAEDLDALPAATLNNMRFGKAAMYALKAHVLMHTQDYTNAAIAAKQALAVNNKMYDYYSNMVPTSGTADDGVTQVTVLTVKRPMLECPDDYFIAMNTIGYNCFTPYSLSLLEPCHVFNEHMNTTQNGKSIAERDKKFEEMLGEPGYLVSFFDNSSWFGSFGLRSSQMYLILAEEAIARNQFDEAMGYLDVIRVNRSVPDLYTPLQGTGINTKAEAIKKLKMVSATEGWFTCWNFITRKRWTQLDDYKETITRTVCGIQMSLTPTSKCWVFPIPINVLNNNPNLKAFMN